MYKLYIFQIVMVDNYAEILETSLKIIFDLFLVFGIEAFAEEDKKEVGIYFSF